MKRELMKPVITRRRLGYADADKWAKKFGYQMPPHQLKAYEAAYEYCAKHRITADEIATMAREARERTPCE